jgi:hypothetical protein
MLHRGATRCIGKLALTLEPNIMVNSTGMSCQYVCLPLKPYLVDVYDQAIAWCQCWVMMAIVLPSYADDGVAESCWWWCCQVLLVMVLLSYTLKIPSHAGDDAAESCRWWRCWGNLVVVWCRYRVMLATVRPSHASDDAAGATWS